MKPRPGRRRKKSLKGTNLEQDPRTGVYQYRWTDPKTGKRRKRSTGMTDKEHAIQEAAKIREDIERETVGLNVFDNWKKELKPLVDEWEQWQKGRVQDNTIRDRVRPLRRVIEKLRLKTCADLKDLSRLKEKLEAYQKKESIKNVTLHRRYQKPLKCFSSWLAMDNRHLEINPLQNWKNIESEDKEPRRRAILPEEMARALLACSYIDHIRGRKFPQRVMLETLLVTAPRITALCERDIEHFHPLSAVIDYGKDVKKKRRGAGALDDVTCARIESFIGDRETGPLFPGPEGPRLDRARSLDIWQECFSLAVVDSLWPKDLPHDLETAYLVSLSLLRRKSVYSKGGNPNLLKRKTKRRLRGVRLEVEDLMDELGFPWGEAMRGVDIHAFRKTHKTWAQSSGILPTATDKQLGHSSFRGGDAPMLLGSVTGRKHYLDVQSKLFDAHGSAKAVRILLENAMTQVMKSNSSQLAHILAHMDKKYQVESNKKKA